MNKNALSKQPKLELKTRPKQVLGSHTVAFALPDTEHEQNCHLRENEWDGTGRDGTGQNEIKW
jgi:hypothetical protein